MRPFYVIRALGGALFLGGTLLMIYNLWRTVRDPATALAPVASAAAPAMA
jgi:cytochrome c oxidase cbb3-type subunit 1